MAMINIHEAKTHFSKLLRRVAAGEEIVIARAGVPVARLDPAIGNVAERKLGAYAGQISWKGDFDAPLPEGLLEDFEGASTT